MEDVQLKALLDKGEQLLEQSRMQEAYDHYEKLSQTMPENAEVWFMFGLINTELGNPESAVNCFHKAIGIDDGHVESHVNLAMLQLAGGDAQSAQRFAQQAVSLDPQFSEAWIALGRSNAMRQDYSAAEQCFLRAIQLWPECADAYFDLANIQQLKGRLDAALQACTSGLVFQANRADIWCQRATLEEHLERFADAEQSSRKAISLDPVNAQSHFILARSLLLQRRASEALSEFEYVVKASPGNVNAWKGLGSAYEALGRMKKATEALHQSLVLDPHIASTWFMLAMLEYQQGNLENALHHCGKAAEIDPGFEPARVLQGDILRIIGRLEESLAAYESILGESHGSTNLNALAGKVMVLDKQGLHKAAYAALRPHLDCGPLDLRLAVAYAGLCQHAGRCDEAIKSLEAILSNKLSDLDPRQQAHQRQEVHNHLGKLYDRAHEYDRAFGHFMEANEYKKLTSPFDPKRHLQLVDGIISDYTRERIGKAPISGCDSNRPLFVLGMPRSGTTLIEQILCSHSSVFGGGELQEMPRIAVDMDERPGNSLVRPPLIDDLTEVKLVRGSARYLNSIGQLSGDAVYITDKLPYNFFHLGLIQLLFPRCRIVHCLRDPLDTCLSVYFQNFSGYQGFATDLQWIAIYYDTYRRLMRHWQQALNLSVHTIWYEDLVENQEMETRKLLEFCGLDWEPDCLEFYKNPRIALTASYNQIRRPLYRTSRRRWKNYEPYLDVVKKLLG